MQNSIEYLSGTIPGGIYLYLLVVITAVIVLYFMYRSSNLITQKKFTRWCIAVFLIITLLYALLWFLNPPAAQYQRYTIDIFESETENNWFGEYLSGCLAENVADYTGRKTFQLYSRDLYRITPADSVANPAFRARLYREMPVQRVLQGEVIQQGSGFRVNLRLCSFPENKIIKQAEAQFSLPQMGPFIRWASAQFSHEIPFSEEIFEKQLTPGDSLLVLAERAFFKKQYKKSNSILTSINSSENNPDVALWRNYVNIKLAALQKDTTWEKPFDLKTPQWRNKLAGARKILVDRLRQGDRRLMSNIMVAESYIWEERYGLAEVFLDEAYAANPFFIETLLNLSFLHRSRYSEFGFSSAEGIYLYILNLCPVAEDVLLKWGRLVLEGNPVYTAPAELVRKQLNRYLKINPLSPAAWILLGQFYSRAGAREEARQAFLKADSLQPDNAAIRYNLGVLFYEWDRVEQAENYFKQAVALNDYSDAHVYLGRIYQLQGDCNAALREYRYRVARRQGPDDKFALEAMKGIRECLAAMDSSAAETVP
ncbi:MAG: tetratricopeptide repeat protein [Calditrichia bacterium]